MPIAFCCQEQRSAWNCADLLLTSDKQSTTMMCVMSRAQLTRASFRKCNLLLSRVRASAEISTDFIRPHITVKAEGNILAYLLLEPSGQLWFRQLCPRSRVVHPCVSEGLVPYPLKASFRLVRCVESNLHPSRETGSQGCTWISHHFIMLSCSLLQNQFESINQ